jgi:hypothetical protein
MTYGKKVCNTLKEIRQQIADRNEIKYKTTECHFQGECEGTCPKCESDLKYLEKELHKRTQLGKAVAVAGISAGILSTCTVSAQNSFPNDSLLNSKETRFVSDTIKTIVQQGESTIKGKVLDDEGKPLDFATVRLMQGDSVVVGTVTNERGEYSLTHIPSGIYDLVINYSEYETYKLKGIKIKDGYTKIIKDVKMEGMLMGKMPLKKSKEK